MRRLETPLAAAAALLLSAALSAAPAGAQTVCKDEGVEYLLGGAAAAGPGCKAAVAPPARRTLRTAASAPAPTQTPSQSSRPRERADFGQDERRLILETELKKAQQVLQGFSQALGGSAGSAAPADKTRALADVRALTAELARLPQAVR
ncbi:hypothetical protein HS961_08300 [Comamonas piscis]|uniref:DUF4124 domain-containing protein n=1 Tax=Comamonas piscis TaxID=1562974 RepID=A0A7G5EFR2_9BURK|nr:hypothetical protein [Comamonas piscis]QMV72837.1 hypothetical protein HS961_08300 [Comamonas piscis]WSO35615.1 hypothetical protein VUJ63_08325 [Comamonas piscis]